MEDFSGRIEVFGSGGAESNFIGRLDDRNFSSYLLAFSGCRFFSHLPPRPPTGEPSPRFRRLRVSIASTSLARARTACAALAVLACAFLVRPPDLRAADVFWNGASSDEWTDPANWDGGVVPGPADTAVFDIFALSADRTVTVAAPVAVAGIRTDALGTELTFSGAAITLAGIDLANAKHGHVIFQTPLVLAADTVLAKGPGDYRATLAGAVSGAFALTLDNAETSKWRVIAVAAANTHSGGTHLAGAIEFADDAAFGSGGVTLAGNVKLRKGDGAQLTADVDTAGYELHFNTGMVVTGAITGAGSVRAHNYVTLAGANTFAGELEIDGKDAVTLTGSLTHANVRMGRKSGGGDAVLDGAGTIVVNLGDPADPASAANDRIDLDWGKHEPHEKPDDPDRSILHAEGLTLDLQIAGTLDEALEYPLLTWQATTNPVHGYAEVSGWVQGAFAVANLPAGWHLHYDGTATHPNALVLASGAPTPPTPPAHVGTGTGIAGAYFPNEEFAGTPALERLDPTPYFDWGSGSPDPAVGSNGFSVRWQARLEPQATGTHHLFLDHDDDARVWVDGALVLAGTGWGAESTTVELTAGAKVDLIVELIEDGGNARAKVEWAHPDVPRRAIPTTQLYPEPLQHAGDGTGLAARYFNNPHLDGEPALTRTDPAIDFDWSSGSPDPVINPDHFSVAWTGALQTQYSEEYTLEFTADDGVAIWLGGRLLIDEWHPNSGSTHSATFQGEAGKKFPLRIVSYEASGFAKARLWWSSASRPRQLVPQDRLYEAEADDLDVLLPAASAVSPAFVEGHVPEGRTADLAITAGTTDVTPQELTSRSFFADLPLDPAAAQPVSLALPDGTPVTGSITWTPTPLDGGEAVVIRQDDRLLFPAAPGSTLTVLTASGTYATQAVPASGQAVFQFPEPGHYIVQDESLNERDVTVVGIDHTAPVACEVGYTRPLDVPLAPDATDAVFGANDPSQLAVGTGAYDATAGLQALDLTPAKRGTPRVTARLGDEQGPILWVREIDEFTVEWLTDDCGITQDFPEKVTKKNLALESPVLDGSEESVPFYGEGNPRGRFSAETIDLRMDDTPRPEQLVLADRTPKAIGVYQTVESMVYRNEFQVWLICVKDDDMETVAPLGHFAWRMAFETDDPPSFEAAKVEIDEEVDGPEGAPTDIVLAGPVCNDVVNAPPVDVREESDETVTVTRSFCGRIVAPDQAESIEGQPGKVDIQVENTSNTEDLSYQLQAILRASSTSVRIGDDPDNVGVDDPEPDRVVGFGITEEPLAPGASRTHTVYFDAELPEFDAELTEEEKFDLARMKITLKTLLLEPHPATGCLIEFEFPRHETLLIVREQSINGEVGAQE